MSMSFFTRGLLIGLSVAAVVGPIALLCIQRTVDRGYLYGLITGLGTATADALYGSIAAFGLTMITSFLISQQHWIHLIGGLFLVYLGCKTLLTRPAEKAAHLKTHKFLTAYTSTLLLTLTNPQTILSFLAIFAGLGLGSGGSNLFSALSVVAGVFLGSALWWCLLAGGISLLRSRFNTHWLLWINRCSGLIILIFGLLALWSLKG